MMDDRSQMTEKRRQLIMEIADMHQHPESSIQYPASLIKYPAGGVP
jgi:hypothetical protein